MGTTYTEDLIQEIKSKVIEGDLIGLDYNFYEAITINPLLEELLQQHRGYLRQIDALNDSVQYWKDIAKENTNKQSGKYKFNVGLYIPYDMGRDYEHYDNIQIIWADNEKEAEQKYNLINKCSYYYGKVLGRLN